MLCLRGVRKCFGSLVAVDDLDLTVQAGTIHALLGPNGAGKSTTLKMVVGLLLPDAGSIEVVGLDAVRDGVRMRARMAYVPDEPYLYERLTGREFLDFTAQVYAVEPGQRRERIAQAVARFACEGFLDEYTEGYSHGMRQRLVLAAAQVHDPELLIVDEPLVGLDPRHIQVVKLWFRELAAAGRTVVMSTHTLAAVEDIADQVTVMDRGRIIAAGSVREVTAGAASLEEAFLRLTGG